MIRKCATYIEISVKTLFYMRHKFHDCIREHMGVGTVNGAIVFVIFYHECNRSIYFVMIKFHFEVNLCT